jgi:hypothetical protein
VCAALFGLPSCSDDGDVTQEGTDAPVDTVPTVVEDPDSMVGQQSIDGRLADAAVVVDPTSGMTDVVTVPDVALAGGVPAGPGRVVYGTDQDLVLVDTTARTVTDLGLPTTQYSVALAAATGGVGRQWDTGEVVDLGTGFQGRTFSPDGRQVAWSSGDAAELRITPVDDRATAEVVTTGVAVPVWLAA